MNRLTTLIVSATGSLLILTGSAVGQDSAAKATPTLQGAWVVEVTVRADALDCNSATLVGTPNPFPSFNTFHEGGTMSEFGTRSPPANRGSGHGVWQRTASDKFRYRVLFHNFDANGLLAATMDIRTHLRLAKSGKKFIGVSRFLRTDISGNEQRFCATMSGERISL